MKKAIICTFALSLFAMPMSLQASPPAKADGATNVVKPLSAMKSTIASPSKSTSVSTKAAKDSKKTIEEKADATKKIAVDAGEAEAKKAAGH